MRVIEAVQYMKSNIIPQSMANKLRKRQDLKDGLECNWMLSEYDRKQYRDAIAQYDKYLADEYTIIPPQKVIEELCKLEQESIAFSLVSNANNMYQIRHACDPAIKMPGKPVIFEDDEMREKSIEAGRRLRAMAERWYVPLEGWSDLVRWGLTNAQGKYLGVTALTRKPGK